jgi:RimJ/RimL family protein N-acetyltransferase
MARGGSISEAREGIRAFSSTATTPSEATMTPSALGPLPSGFALREVSEDDLPILFEQQLDPDANRMAAFVSKDPADKTAFVAHWRKLLANPAIVKNAILLDGRLAGSVASYPQDGRREVTYWLGKEFWGRGLATQALAEFIRRTAERPLGARVAKDNIASLRVLEKCGFVIRGEDKGFANARGEEIEEWILELV